MLLLFVGCAHLVDVSVVGATIAPTMANQAPWDGPDNVAPGALDLFTKLANKVDASGQLATAATGIAAAAAAPDPQGTVTLVTQDERNGEQQMLTLAHEDTTTPDWTAAPATFSNVTLNHDVRLRIALVDKDYVTDDPIGTVELSAADLETARVAGAPTAIDVSKQSSGQLLTVKVVVTPR